MSEAHESGTTGTILMLPGACCGAWIYNDFCNYFQEKGWAVSRERGLGKSSVRRITKDGESLLVSIRTSQDQWIAFPPKPEGEGFITLDDVDVQVELRISAPSAVSAHREIVRFLAEHDGDTWSVESVSREADRVRHPQPRGVAHGFSIVRWA